MQRVIFTDNSMSGRKVALIEWGPDTPGHHKLYSRCSGDAHNGEEQPMVSGFRLIVGSEEADICWDCIHGPEDKYPGLPKRTPEYDEALAQVVAMKIMEGSECHSDQAVDGVRELLKFQGVFGTLRIMYNDEVLEYIEKNREYLDDHEGYDI